ncbi:MAG: SET domain-containing protein-lysine N-methyltransferase [Piscinibacter sp.]|nr:SET domain-containing protein-lysine N-methyltransferase [Piscinibacter sp.]
MTIRSPYVYVKDTGTPKGRGAFASRTHAKGEVVESCPVVLFSGSFSSIPGEVRQLLFNWGVLAKDDGSSHCLALGYGSMYNHENPANMRYEADPEAGVLRFIAIRDIAANEELTVNYNAVGGGPESDKDTWFSGMGISPFAPGDADGGH